MHDTCVVATVDASGQPMAATVGFSHDQADMTIMFATSNLTRKYKNLMNSNKVAVVVGLEGDQTFQYEGVVKAYNAEQISDRLEKHYAKVPGARKFANDEGQTYFIVTPTWYRYTNYADPDSPYEKEYNA